MSVTPRLDIVHHFAAVQDPRDPRFMTHLLGDVLTISLCATLAGAKSFEDLATFGRTKESWLRSLGLTLPHGIPSHDTFRDLFRHLAPGRLPGLLHLLDQRRLRPLGDPACPDRWQGPARQPWSGRHLPASGQRLGRSQLPDLGTGGRRGQVQRDHRHPQVAEAVGVARGVGVD